MKPFSDEVCEPVIEKLRKEKSPTQQLRKAEAHLRIFASIIDRMEAELLAHGIEPWPMNTMPRELTAA